MTIYFDFTYRTYNQLIKYDALLYIKGYAKLCWDEFISKNDTFKTFPATKLTGE